MRRFPSSTQDLWSALVAALESHYGVFIDVDEMTADNFRNLAAIKAVLTTKGVSP